MWKLLVVLALFGTVLGLPTNRTVPRLDGRIVGGTEADIEHHPWQLALLYYLRHFCGATLIQSSWGLTAAHCLEGALVANLAARAGSTLKSSGGQIVDVRLFHIHPNYNVRTVDYDFALLHFDEPVAIQTAGLAALPELDYPILQGDTAIMTGWGLLSPNGASPELLHVTQVPVVDHSRCQAIYTAYEVTPRMFCTGRLGVGGVDACQGDGGGPVQVNGYIVGIVSWGIGCASADYPSVHSNIVSVLPWIYETAL